MAYYYVRTHADGTGTATGDQGRYATQQTGDWDTTFAATTGYYATIELALAATTPPVAGDFIMVSDIHDFTDGGTISYGLATNQYIMTYSVDDTAMDAYVAGATERTAATNDIAFETNEYGQHFHGFTFYIEDDFRMSSANSAADLVDCTVNFTGTGDRFILTPGDSSTLALTNTTVNWAVGTTDEAFLLANDAYVRVFGVSFNATTSTLNDLIGGGVSAANGGLNAEFIGCDLSDFTGYLLGSTGATKSTDDNIWLRVDKCSVGASLTGFVEEAFVSPGHEVLITHSASTSAAAEYQFYYKNWVGTAEDQNSAGIVRADSTAFADGGETVSIQAITTANASIGSPFRFSLPARFAALSNASTDTIRIYFTVVNTTTLTDADVWAELIYPDGTNKHIHNYLSNRNADPIAIGTTHTTDSGSVWENNGVDLTGYNEYYMDLDTSGDPGADSVPKIRINIAAPSETIYFCTTVDVVA